MWFRKETQRIPIAHIIVDGKYKCSERKMTNYHCCYHRQRGMSAPLWFWRNTNSAGTNNKTNKMKKFLLLLSCFLATWCSVQAAAPEGWINSATYNAYNSTVSVNFTTNYCSCVRLELMYMANNGYYKHVTPLCVTECNVQNKYGYTASATLNVDGTLEEGYYFVGIYQQGSLKIMNAPKSVKNKVTANGSIKDNIKYDNGKVSVEYTMWHGYNNSARIGIYDENNKSLYELPAPNTKVNEFEEITFPKELSDGKYTCRLSYRGKELYRKPFEVNSHWYNGLKLAKEGNSIKVDFTLRDTEVNVGIVLYDLKTYTTKNVDLGTWSEHTGTTYIGVPPSNGPTTYVATLMVNGVSVNGAQIYTR